MGLTAPPLVPLSMQSSPLGSIPSNSRSSIMQQTSVWLPLLCFYFSGDMHSPSRPALLRIHRSVVGLAMIVHANGHVSRCTHHEPVKDTFGAPYDPSDERIIMAQQWLQSSTTLCRKDETIEALLGTAASASCDPFSPIPSLSAP